MQIPSNVLKAEFDKLVQYHIEKINIAETIKVIKQGLVDEGMEKSEVAALVKVAAAKAKEDVEGLESATKMLQDMLDAVA